MELIKRTVQRTISHIYTTHTHVIDLIVILCPANCSRSRCDWLSLPILIILMVCVCVDIRQKLYIYIYICVYKVVNFTQISWMSRMCTLNSLHLKDSTNRWVHEVDFVSDSTCPVTITHENVMWFMDGQEQNNSELLVKKQQQQQNVPHKRLSRIKATSG